MNAVQITNPGTAFQPKALTVAIVTVLAGQINEWRRKKNEEEFAAQHRRRMERHARVQDQVDLMRRQNIKVEGEFKLREPAGEGLDVSPDLSQLLPEMELVKAIAQDQNSEVNK